MSGLLSCCAQRAFAGLLVLAGALMSLEASTSPGHAVTCQPEIFQPAYCKPPSLYFNNSGLGCYDNNGICERVPDSRVCEEQAYWASIAPAHCVFAVTNSTSGICLMGYATKVVQVHYMHTVCKNSEGLCSCKGVAFTDLVIEEEVCTCGDLAIP